MGIVGDNMRYLVHFLVLIIGISFMATTAKAEKFSFEKTEILLIPWGDDIDNLSIIEPHLEDSEGGIKYLMPSGGPRQGFVGMNDVIYISSEAPGYFKAFNIEGKAVINFTPSEANYNDSLFLGSVSNFYVDSLSNIYFESFSPRSFITICNSIGNIIQRLYPCGDSSHAIVSLIGWGYADILNLECWNNGFYSYSNTTVVPGGSCSFKARDGNYYDAIKVPIAKVKFIKFANATISGEADSLETKLIPMTDNITGCKFIGVDDSMHIILNIFHEDSVRIDEGIQIYNTNYDLLSEFWFDPIQQNRFLVKMDGPFLRHDGNIYEFRCLDDGLHVVKWERK